MRPPLHLAAGLVSFLLLASGCADPVVQYHRQFDYLVREGGEALEEGRFEEAREQLSDAAGIAPFAAASDLDVIGARTDLTRACRELGKLEEAVAHANVAGQDLAKYRLEHGGTSSRVRSVGGAYLLERGRLEVARGDFAMAEEAVADFVRVRGEDGGNATDGTEAQLLLGALRLARGFEDDARTHFRKSLDAARGLGDDRRALRGFALLRAAERKTSSDRVEKAISLAAEARDDGAVVPALRPGMRLLNAHVDVAQGNVERAGIRLEEALVLLESGGPAVQREIAAPERAIALAVRLHDGAEESDRIAKVVRRSLRATRTGSPLRRLLAGRAAVEAGRQSLAAGARSSGLRMMEAGRRAIDGATHGRVHDAGVRADYEIAVARERLGDLAGAAAPCVRVSAATAGLSPEARAAHPERLLACGRIAALRRDALEARRAFGRALMIVEEADTGAGTPVLQMELLLRLAALAHDEGRDAEEGKLFDRVLPFVLPGVYEDLGRLLVSAYGPYGRYRPSSAAARLGHAAARSHSYVVEAPQLQTLAEELGQETFPASRR